MSGKDRTRGQRIYRATLAVYAGTFVALLLAEVTTRGHAAVFSVLLFVFATMAIGLETYVIRRQREMVAAANRPRPDYIAIARMEREVYGETFDHDGAPSAGSGPVASMLLPPELHPLVTPKVQPGAFGTLAYLRRAARDSDRSARDSQFRSERFWRNMEEARRLIRQLEAAQDDDRRPGA